MSRVPIGISTSRWGPYVVAGVLLLADYLLLARGLSHARPGYEVWSLNHGVYSDTVKLSLNHYVRGAHVIHPIPYLHDRIEYPVLLGFVLWLPAWLPGGPPTWFAAAGILTAAATFGSIALLRGRSPGAAWWIAASPALLLDAGINWDLIGVFFLVGGVVWFGERRLRLSAVSTAVGTLFKLFPVVVAPMALSALGSQWWRSLGQAGSRGGDQPAGGERDDTEPVDAEPVDTEPEDPTRPSPLAALTRWSVPFALVCTVVMVPFLVLARSNTLWFFRFNTQRPQKDSIWDLLGRVFGTSLVSSHAINTASLLVVMAATAYGAWLVWRAPTPDHPRAVALASAMAIIVWMAVNKVWNPQYVLWVFAAGAMASMPVRFGVVLSVVSVYDYWFEFVLRVPDQTHSYSWIGFGAVVARTAIFAVMAAWAVGELRRLTEVTVDTMNEGIPAPSRS